MSGQGSEFLKRMFDLTSHVNEFSDPLPSGPRTMTGIAIQEAADRHNLNSRIAQAEWEVVEAACAYREIEVKSHNMSLNQMFAADLMPAFADTREVLRKKTDRLLSLRQEAEKET